MGMASDWRAIVLHTQWDWLLIGWSIGWAVYKGLSNGSEIRLCWTGAERGAVPETVYHWITHTEDSGEYTA